MKMSKLLIIISLSILVSCDKSTNPDDSSFSWILQREKQDDITYYSIFFPDKNNGWICGYNGTIKKSSDGGSNWQSQQSNVSANLWDISFFNNQIGWICGDKTILKTTDGGDTWIDISPTTQEEKIYVNIKFIDENNGWTSSNIGEILSTSNGGQSWEIKMKGLFGGSRLIAINSQTVYALSGKLYKTNNGGATWDSVEVSVPKNYRASEMYFVDSNNGWIGTQNGTGGTMITDFPVVITNDGGKSWLASELLEDRGLRCVYFINKNTGWVAGSQNIYKTIDGGNSWSFEFSPPNGGVYAKDIHFIDEGCGWIINWDGVVYKYEKQL